MSEDLADKARFVRCEDLLEADVNGEIVALHIERGQCYGLNEAASRIWNLLARPMTIDQLCEALVQEYDVDEASCRADIKALVSDLRSEGLLKETNG